MNTDDVRSFRLTAELGSFTRAAEQLLVSQPAVSQRIRHLEQELGTEFFTRRGRGVDLLPAGEVLLDFARQLENLLHQLETNLDAVHPVVRTVVIGAGPVTARWILPKLLSPFFRLMPEGHVRIVILPGRQAHGELLNGNIDFGVLHPNMLTRELDAETLGPLCMQLIVPRGHPLTGRTPPAAREIAEYPFVSGTVMTESRQVLHQWALFNGVRPRVALEVDSYDAVIAAVRNGIGIGFALNATVVEDVARGDLAVIDVTPAPSEFNLCFAYRRGANLSLPAQMMRSVISKRAQISSMTSAVPVQ